MGMVFGYLVPEIGYMKKLTSVSFQSNNLHIIALEVIALVVSIGYLKKNYYIKTLLVLMYIYHTVILTNEIVKLRYNKLKSEVLGNSWLLYLAQYLVYFCVSSVYPFLKRA